MQIEDAHNESLLARNDTPIKPNTKGDKHNIFLLLILYTLQGVPMGLSLTIPIIMQNKHKTSFNDQVYMILLIITVYN